MPIETIGLIEVGSHDQIGEKYLFNPLDYFVVQVNTQVIIKHSI